MKLEICNFSGAKIYPGHGRKYVRVDGRAYYFVNSKCNSLFLNRKNPRKILWTVLYRRKHKKGAVEEIAKRRTRKTTKFQRDVQGATLDLILAKRNQKPEVRKAQREQALRAAKEKKKVALAKEKTSARAAAVKSAPKVVQKGAKVKPTVGGKR
eukprot:Sdes_comp17968_c0_seq2m7222